MISPQKTEKRKLNNKHYVSLSPDCLIRLLEKPHIYHLGNDELYEINNNAFEFFKLCDGKHRLNELKPDRDFLDFCLQEGIIRLSPNDGQNKDLLFQKPVTLLSPSLRYLEIQITGRCNLKCRHCYLKPASPQDLSLSEVKELITEFYHLQGLKVLISGGEPLLHPQIGEILKFLKKVRVRSVLLTNGTLITPRNISSLRGVREIQISLDGLKEGHEYFRGKGTFKKTIDAIRLCRREGFDVSVATMLHPKNLEDIEPLSSLLQEIGVVEWGIDVPCNCIEGDQSRFFGLTPEKAAPYLKFAFGGRFHGGFEGFSCGRHLCTVMPDGHVCKCGFYAESPLGHIREGLARCWARLLHIPLSRLECKDCQHLEECGGGCRKRADSETGPDPIMCAFYRHKSSESANR